MISYEDVLSDPSAVYSQIHSKFFSNQEKLPESEIDRIRDKQGIKPNSATSYGWRETYSDADLELFAAQINHDDTYLSDNKTHS